jgi:hypothetical protein
MADLRGRNAPGRVEFGATTKVVGAAIIALVIGAIGAYTVESGMWKPHPKQVVASNQLPSPTLPSH